eukprot:scaffold179010_cov24-Tisochrysis_lutea.AAC.1
MLGGPNRESSGLAASALSGTNPSGRSLSCGPLAPPLVPAHPASPLRICRSVSVIGSLTTPASTLPPPSTTKALPPSLSLKTLVDLPKTSDLPGATVYGLFGWRALPDRVVPCAEWRSVTVSEPLAETVSLACSRETEAWVSSMSATPS